MRISKASIASGVSTGMIRRYERMGLMPPTHRLENGYRDYTSEDVMRLRFIHTFNELGFPLNEIKDLLSPWDGSHSVKADLQALARAQAQELGRRAQILLAAQKAWNELAEQSCGSQAHGSPVQVIAAPVPPK